MVKLFKYALGKVTGEARRKLSLIELQVFVSDAVRIVNDRPLISVSSHPNDLLSISPSSFLGQQLLRIPLLAPSTIGEIYDEIICIMSPLLISFENLGARFIYRRCKAVVNGELLVKILPKANLY